MQKYKIKTLGNEFVVVCTGFGIESAAASRSVSENCAVIEIKNDLRCDYRISLPAQECVFLPDIKRALLIFLHRIRGLPSADYDLIEDKSERCIRLPYFSGLYGGNVGKCKLLSSKKCDTCSKNGIELYMIEAPDGIYIIVVCDNPFAVDLKNIISVSVADESFGGKLRGAVAVCVNDLEIKMVSKTFQGNEMSDTSAYAAVSFLMSLLFDLSPSVIRCGEYVAKCDLDGTSVFVYDLSPKVYSLI